MMRDSGLYNLLVTLGMDSAFFVCCCLLKLYREKWHQYEPVGPGPAASSNLLSRQDASSGVRRTRCGVGHQYYPWPLNLVLQRLGDARTFTGSSNLFWVLARLQQLAMALLLVMACFSIIVLIPIYVIFGANDGVTKPMFLEEVSVHNLQNRGWMSVTVLVAIIYIVLIWRTASAFLKETSCTRPPSASQPTTRPCESVRARTIHIWQVAKFGLSEEAHFSAFLSTCFPGQVSYLHLVPDMTKVHHLHDQTKKISLELDRCRASEATASEERKSYWKKKCESLVAKKKQTSERLTDALAYAMSDGCRNSGHAFVTFNSFEQARTALEVMTAKEYLDLPLADINKAAQWKCAPAPSSSDLCWKNLSVSANERCLRRIVGPFMLSLLMALIITPTTCLQRLQWLWWDVRGRQPSDDQELQFLSAQLPSLAVFLVNAMLLPLLINREARFERHILRSDAERSALRLNAVFLFFNVILLPTLALHSIDAFVHSKFATDIKHWKELFGPVLSSSAGEFFMQYFIHAALLSPGAEFVDLGQLVVQFYLTKRAKTPSELQQARAVWEYSFGYSIAYSLTLFGLALLYSTTTPLIVPFALFYFATSSTVSKIVISNGVRRVEVGRLGSLAPAVASGILAYLVLFQFSVSAVLGVQEQVVLQSIAAVLLVSAVISSAQWTLTYAFGPMSSIGAAAFDNNKNEEFDVYKHPLLRIGPRHSIIAGKLSR